MGILGTRRSLLMATLLVAGSSAAFGQAPAPGPRLEIYGYVQADFGYDFNQINPDWFDVLRVSQLPTSENQYGEDGRTWASVRNSRLGVRSWMPTSLGEIKTVFEFDLFGTGVDAGQTTFHLRHFWGELGDFGMGQYNTPFMDMDVFPNILEIWGPPAMVGFRNIQVRWMPLRGKDELFVALERPGASADGGVYADRVALENVKIRTPLPDLTAHYRRTDSWGHVQLSGILRKIRWDDLNNDPYDLSGSATAWGLHLSTNIKVGAADLIRASVAYGEGIQSYFTDSGVDIGIQRNPGDPVHPIVGKALPIMGFVGYYEHPWNRNLSTVVGYSYEYTWNTNGQAPTSLKRIDYATANLLYTPTPGVTIGSEMQWGRRESFTDEFTANDTRIQFTFKYNFSWMLGGK